VDLVSLLLVLAFCLVGALIAYGADLLGRHLGKKRLSIFGLRPKYTAVLVATTAGFLLPMLTMGVLGLVSRDVRIILAEGSRAAAERDRKAAELREVNVRLEAAAGETRRVEAELRGRTAELDRAGLTLAERNEELRTRRAEIDALQSQTARLRRTVADVRAQIAVERLRLVQLQGSYDRLRVTFEETNTSFAVLLGQIRDANEHSQQLGLEAQRLEREILTGEERFAEVQQRERRARDELETTSRAFDALQQQFDEERLRSARDLELARLDLDRLRVEAASLVAVTQALGASMDFARTRPMIYRMGDELARLVEPGGATPDGAAAAVEALLRAARLEAQRRGAAPEGNLAAASLRDVTVGGRPVSAAEQEAQLVRQVQRSREPVVLLAHAIWNAYEGESVPLRVQVRPNPLVYTQGAVLAETRVDEGLSEAAVLERLSRLVTEQVRPRDLRDGLIPAAGRAEPLGEVTHAVVLQVVQEVTTAGRPVRIVAVAAADTRAAEPLRLEFRVR